MCSFRSIRILILGGIAGAAMLIQFSCSQKGQPNHKLNKEEIVQLPVQPSEDPFVTFVNVQLDTALIFGIWTVDTAGPHADFWLTATSFYVVDFDGDGRMSYTLEDSSLLVYYPEFTYRGDVLHSVKDTLAIRWQDSDETTIYVPFPQ